MVLRNTNIQTLNLSHIIILSFELNKIKSKCPAYDKKKLRPAFPFEWIFYNSFVAWWQYNLHFIITTQKYLRTFVSRSHNSLTCNNDDDNNNNNIHNRIPYMYMLIPYVPLARVIASLCLRNQQKNRLPSSRLSYKY